VKKNVTIILLSAIIALYALFRLLMVVLPSLDYEKQSSKTSPNGNSELTLFQSQSEAGHAPYGEHLVLHSTRKVLNPDKGHVIFAGYCESGLDYSWKSDKEIVVKCAPSGKVPILTSSTIAYGVSIEVISSE